MNERNWQPIETAPQEGRMFIAFAITDTDTGNWHMAIVSHNHYREVGMGESQWTGWPRYSAEPTHWMPLPQPPAELSGNTGEFKCATCRDTKQVPFVYGQEYDCVMSTTVPCPDCSVAQPARHSEALSSFTAYCKEHPSERFWQALRNWSRWGYILGAQTRDGGTIDTFNLEGLDGTHATQTATEQPRIWRDVGIGSIGYQTDIEHVARLRASLYCGKVQFSTDNGKTWIDEQAEGKPE